MDDSDSNDGSISCEDQSESGGSGSLEGMVEIPAGMFEMGSEIVLNESPIRQVYVDSFLIDRTEVTVEQYSKCVDDGICGVPRIGGNCNWMVMGRDNHPVNCVMWFDAKDYCGWAGKHLPTEAEWEKAARGVDSRSYPWGDAPEPSCTHVAMSEDGGGCNLQSTMPVGCKPLGSSPYGVLDMAGNVWEWVMDNYASSYDPLETENPVGSTMGDLRVLRGGEYREYPPPPGVRIGNLHSK
ncbi:MAG: SUMF1/EgtB/PvdO family nonheme iron enzyme, partial [Myxococcota bacterium]